ncbi:hypothetical protein HPDFL43_05810 [Hoeflea phototrophica DFL-43]|uniref:RecA/RadA recombinase n=1 Tax=Hoeflea phototrophica (strain DSM 17068 / NCIMB 14078 / DFL-43) TaxID=411684 RepID=A9D4R8_HOEPD|nr:DUF2190 family protein [Hoeflea phototrophica]EDQ33945.1 hypothetical protein HPDFL43_05810 [Hoeflea phototrophica DFL-43]
MKNYVQPGDVLTVAAPSGGVVSGAAVVIGNLRGFASATAAAGDDVAIARSGVFSTAIKAAGVAWAVGDLIYLKADGTEFNKTASGNTLFGFASEPADSAATTGKICLT